jgi:hypothetical protein
MYFLGVNHCNEKKSLQQQKSFLVAKYSSLNLMNAIRSRRSRFSLLIVKLKQLRRPEIERSVRLIWMFNDSAYFNSTLKAPLNVIFYCLILWFVWLKLKIQKNLHLNGKSLMFIFIWNILLTQQLYFFQVC